MRHLQPISLVLCFAFILLSSDVSSSGLALPVSVPAVILLEHKDVDYPTFHGVHIVDIEGTHTTLFTPQDGHHFDRLEKNWLVIDDGMAGFNLWEEAPILVESPPLEAISLPENNPLEVIQAVQGFDFKPLFGPQVIEFSDSGYAWANGRLYVMSGEEDTMVNLYAIVDGQLKQLTDVRRLFPDVQESVLSASVEFIADRPKIPGFLYRARLRGAEGQDHNALFFYDIQEEKTEAMPFFGKKPVWSPDGTALAGSRFDEVKDPQLGVPLYSLWVVDIETNAEQRIAHGCNPRWSSDGEWIAYDVHQDSRWQSYIDCFASGDVEGIYLRTGDVIRFSDELAGFVTLIDWLPSPQSAEN